MKAYDCEEFKDLFFSVPMGLSRLSKFSVRQAILGIGPPCPERPFSRQLLEYSGMKSRWKVSNVNVRMCKAPST